MSNLYRNLTKIGENELIFYFFSDMMYDEECVVKDYGD